MRDAEGQAALPPDEREAWTKLWSDVRDLANRTQKPPIIVDPKLPIIVNPKDAAGYYQLGQTLMKQNKPAEAIEAYNAAIKLNPSYFDA